ncbi:MAG: type II toxin-antitoxin system HicB family antitoxin [Gammaproteobacteria bacterium]|nr:type II toxin-antitoxin system HicB family antitoxin [Gammaproteobacteria bacterium]MCP4832185.1 type II toxin-antitoxin system HicB family antitoxin [Gammaproteobacteria bacterium]
MLVPVCITKEADGRLLASVPDIPDVTASGSELDRTLTRIHLKLEGYVSELLLAEQPLPEIRTLKEIQNSVQIADCYEIHINLMHLQAVAKHQWGK